MSRRLLSLTLGDPAGIGAEIIAKAWTVLRSEPTPFFVIGDAAIMAAQDVPTAVIDDPASAAERFSSALPVLDLPLSGPPPHPGRPEPAHAAAIIGWIEKAVALALSGHVAAVVTAPIAKAPLYAAGFKFPGHTEFLADLTATTPLDGMRGPVMMLAAGDLKASLTTIHEPLAKVPGALTIGKVVRTATVTAQALRRDFGIGAPRLALAGLNPHSGESGTIGREEIDILIPAAEQLRAQGIDIIGPSPSDTLFHDEARRRYDAVICLYHDQALIPVKMLDFWGGVNITLGLPIVRTSPDHGTGFDIAGRGIARADSLIAAIRSAADMSARRAAYVPS